MANSYGFFIGRKEINTIEKLEEEIQKVLYQPRYNAKKIYESTMSNNYKNATYEISGQGCVQIILSREKDIKFLHKDKVELVNGCIVCIGFKEKSSFKKSLDSKFCELLDKCNE